jgi:glycosyltransferase involved in cell wall biosynthesis
MPDTSFAIIIPSYNSADFVAATIRSALIQNAENVIVVDDGSTDATPAVCAEFGDQITYHRVPNGGVCKARNLGATLTSAEWLLFLDSDDLLLEGAATALVARARGEKCGVAYGGVMRRGKTREEDTIISHPHIAGAPPVPALANFRRSLIITPGCAVVHRDVFAWVGGFVDGFQPMEDRDFWVKAGLRTGFAFCERTVLDKGWREGSALTRTDLRIINGLRSQLLLPAWCRERGVDTCFLPASPTTLIRQTFNDAGYRRLWSIFPKLTAIALRYWTGCRV